MPANIWPEILYPPLTLVSLCPGERESGGRAVRGRPTVGRRKRFFNDPETINFISCSSSAAAAFVNRAAAQPVRLAGGPLAAAAASSFARLLPSQGYFLARIEQGGTL